MTVSSVRRGRTVLGAMRWAELRDFFAYHGVWAIGVRLLRKLSVRSKVLVVVGILLAPVGPMAWHLVQDENQFVAIANQGLAGVRLAAAVWKLDSALSEQQARTDATGAPAAALPSPHAELLAAVAAARQAGLPVDQAWERTAPVVEHALAPGPVSVATRDELAAAAAQALVDMRREAFSADDMDFGYDRELRAHSRLALDDLPDMQLRLHALRLLVDRQLATDAAATAPQRHEALLRLADAVQALHRVDVRSEGRIRASQGRGATPAPALPGVQHYAELVARQLLAYEPAPDAVALHELGAAARAEVNQRRGAELAALESLLQRDLAQAQETRTWVLGALAAAGCLSLYLLYTFFLVMRGGLVQLNQHMNRMARGDLSARLTPLGVDEVAMTMTAMTTALVRLSDLLASVRQGVGAANQASQQVASGNADLSKRSRDTAASLQSLVDSVTRCSACLEACGRQVEAVVGTVQALRLQSVRNRKQMNRLRERMKALRGNSREIGEIVTLIDNIAFRTNVLALNASVEASKAGEAGRGFAVVAQEVRSLAQRGAESARRIGAIVGRSTDDIEFSGALAEETETALAAADQHVDRIHLAMDDVASLTRNGEQESAAILAQVNQIKDSTAQNLKLVEQLAGASDALRLQGERLTHRVGQFTLS